MSVSLRQVNRTASRQLQQRPFSRCLTGKRVTQRLPQTLQTLNVHQTQPFQSSFSTMVALKSNAPAMTGGSREFDPEIKDMASYIHNYKIDSDLAVRDLSRSLRQESH